MMWRTHSCVLRRDSSRRPALVHRTPLKLALALALLLLPACGLRRNPLALTTLTPEALPALESDFNRAAGETRVILLLSPT